MSINSTGHHRTKRQEQHRSVATVFPFVLTLLTDWDGLRRNASGTYRHICQSVSLMNCAARANRGKQTEDELSCRARMPRQRVPWFSVAVWAKIGGLIPGLVVDVAVAAVAAAEVVHAAGADAVAVSALGKTAVREEAPQTRFGGLADTAPEG